MFKNNLKFVASLANGRVKDVDFKPNIIRQNRKNHLVQFYIWYNFHKKIGLPKKVNDSVVVFQRCHILAICYPSVIILLKL